MRSVVVVLPASTWAMIPILRTSLSIVFGRRSRDALALVPLVVGFVLGEWMVVTGTGSFADLTAFLGVIVFGLLWLTFSRESFGWEAFGTLAIFMMMLFIQRANRRDNLALHAKLDELLRVDTDARSELTQLDEQEPEEIEQHRDEEVRKTDA